MNLRTLRYLIALAEYLNFSRAADCCAVSQSTLSIQLRKLEDYLGVALFERDRAHVTMTAEGREVLRLARVIVGAVDEIVVFGRSQARREVCECESTKGAPVLIDSINYRRCRSH